MKLYKFHICGYEEKVSAKGTVYYTMNVAVFKSRPYKDTFFHEIKDYFIKFSNGEQDSIFSATGVDYKDENYVDKLVGKEGFCELEEVTTKYGNKRMVISKFHPSSFVPCEMVEASNEPKQEDFFDDKIPF